MKNTFKKIAATLSAAVMCALPTVNALSANAAAGSNARYTYRTTICADSTGYVSEVSFAYSVKKSHTSAPFPTFLNGGTNRGTTSAGDTYYSCGGTYTSNSTFGGVLMTISAYTDAPQYFVQGSTNIRAYNTDGNEVYNALNCSPHAFLVGDFNGDNIIDGYDYSILDYVVNQTSIPTYGFTWTTTVWGSDYIRVAQFDINNDGQINSADTAMHLSYISGQLQKFPS